MDRHSTETIWNEALALIREKVNDGTYRIWFEPTLGLEFTGDVFVVGVSSEFAKDWIEARFLPLMIDAVSEAVGDRVGCRLLISPEVAARLPGHIAPAHGEPNDASSPAGEASRAAASVVGGAGDATARAGGGSFRARGPQRPPAAGPSLPHEIGLNEKYTFESFVIGPSNRFAHAAALAAAETVS